VSSNGGSFSYLSFHVGTDWMVRTSAYDDEAPILTVDAGPGAVAIMVKDRHAVGESAVEFARALAREAQTFATEVERLHVGQPGSADDGDTKADAETAA
jgi:hypothetical protein